MNLLSLLEHLEYKCLQGSTEQEVSSVVYDSRKVEEGSLFICIRGAVVDGINLYLMLWQGCEDTHRGRSGGGTGGCDK